MQEGRDQNSATLYLLCNAVKVFILYCNGLKNKYGALFKNHNLSEMTIGKVQQDKIRIRTKYKRWPAEGGEDTIEG